MRLLDAAEFHYAFNGRSGGLYCVYWTLRGFNMRLLDAVARAVESRLARGETPALRQVSLKGNMLSKRALNRICAVNRVLSSRSGSADIDFDAVDLGGFLYEKKESAL